MKMRDQGGKTSPVENYVMKLAEKQETLAPTTLVAKGHNFVEKQLNNTDFRT